MPPKKVIASKEVVSQPLKKSSPKEEVQIQFAEADYSEITPPESNYDLNVELMDKVDNLCRKLENASKAQQEFVDVFSELKEFSNTSIKDIDIKIKRKDEECYNKYNKLSKDFALKVYNLKSSYEQKQYELEKEFKQKKDNMERDFTQYEYSKAVEVLNVKGEIPVKANEFNKLKDDFAQLEKSQDKKEKELIAINDAKWKKELDITLKTKDLQFQAISADMKAKVDQLTREVTVLQETIGNYKIELQEQRNLTRSVAEASQGAVTQNFGKQ